MTSIMTFSITEANRDVRSHFKPEVRGVVSSALFNSDVVGTGAITRFVTSSQSHCFNFDLAIMTSRVECEEVLMPADLNSVEDLDEWLMGLNLE